MTILTDLLAHFIAQVPGQSPYTARNYRQRLMPLIESLPDGESSSLTVETVNAWDQAQVARGLAPATIAGFRQVAKTFCAYLVSIGELEESPADHLRVGSWLAQRPKLPAEPAVQKALAVARVWSSTSSDASKIRDAAIFLVSFESGARRDEIRRLTVAEIVRAIETGVDAHGISRARSFGKTGAVVLRLGRESMWSLRRWLEVRPASKSSRCFVSTRRRRIVGQRRFDYQPLSISGFDKAFEKVSAAAGLMRPIRSHALRHRLGDRVTREFGPRVGAMALNHKNPDNPIVALRFYHHPDEGDVAAAMASAARGDCLVDSLFGNVDK